MKLLQLAVAVLCLQANAQKVQRRLITNKPRHPAELAADIVEHAVTTGAEPYLEIRMPSLAWWQLTLLDVKLVLLTIQAAAILAVVCGLWSVNQSSCLHVLMCAGQCKIMNINLDIPDLPNLVPDVSVLIGNHADSAKPSLFLAKCTL